MHCIKYFYLSIAGKHAHNFITRKAYKIVHLQYINVKLALM